MRNKLEILALAFLVTTIVNCSESSDSASEAATSTTTASTVTLTADIYSVALGGTVYVTATGGSGTYSSATVSEGSIYQSNTELFVYTAPTSTANSTITISVTDSSGNIGYAYIFISGTTSTTTSALSCNGTYDANIGGIAATISMVGDVSGNVSGYIYMASYYYPILGTCSISGTSGTISFTNLSLNHAYTGTIALSSSNQVYISGSLTASGNTYSWAALSRNAVTTASSVAQTCQGNYSAVIAGNTGSMVLIEDGSNNIAGYLYLQGYYYALKGTCYGGSGTISFTNHTTNSTYTGTVTFSGTYRYLAGTFSLSSGTVYNWSASSH